MYQLWLVNMNNVNFVLNFNYYFDVKSAFNIEENIAVFEDNNFLLISWNDIHAF